MENMVKSDDNLCSKGIEVVGANWQRKVVGACRTCALLNTYMKHTRRNLKRYEDFFWRIVTTRWMGSGVASEHDADDVAHGHTREGLSVR